MGQKSEAEYALDEMFGNPLEQLDDICDVITYEEIEWHKVVVQPTKTT